MRIGLAADHGGFALKQTLLHDVPQRLGGQGLPLTLVDFGASLLQPDDDYPDYVIPLAEAVAQGQVARGIAICGSGVGACMVANKLPGVRASVAHDVYSAHQGVEHDAMNILCLGARVVGVALAMEIVAAFLKAEFNGEERYQRRLKKLAVFETLVRSFEHSPVEHQLPEYHSSVTSQPV